MTSIRYTTREAVMRAGDIAHTARTATQIDRTIEARSRSIEGFLHRRFYPEIATRYFDWPNPNRPRPWRLWLDDNDLISVTTLVAGGVTISSSDYFLRRSDNRDEPPYTHIEIDLSSTASFASGDTHQRAIAITGLWGYTGDHTDAGTLAAAVTTTTATTIDVTDSAAIGIGDLIHPDYGGAGEVYEHMLVTGKTMLTTGQTLQSALTASSGDVTVSVTDGTAYSVDEEILLDSERMLIVDIAGNDLTVKRAWNGTVLAAHTGSTIYAPRRLTVERGVVGTTAATHLINATLARHDPPPLVASLCIAETLDTLEQESAGYARQSGAGASAREATGGGLDAIRMAAYAAHGRKARMRAV